MKKYRTKPVTVEAVQLRWGTWEEMCEFAKVGKLDDGKPQGIKGLPDSRIGMYIPTPEGVLVAEENDWIIKDASGGLSVCKSYIFEEIYEEVDDQEKK